ncbi:hypothetical protein CF65_00173 [Aggregatibacter actinomycetemcomitans HK1651]|nr:hypothetical protein CF65_00173 [Aggregatibacter actinomycetemcomitans HK1651]
MKGENKKCGDFFHCFSALENTAKNHRTFMS